MTYEPEALTSSGWTTSSGWPPSASVVPASTQLLWALEALLLAPVLLLVASGCGPTGAPSSEPETRKMSRRSRPPTSGPVGFSKNRGAHLSSLRPLNSPPVNRSSGPQLPTFPPPPRCPPPLWPPPPWYPGPGLQPSSPLLWKSWPPSKSCGPRRPCWFSPQ